MLAEVRANVRAFAEREVAPHAEHIHRHDELVPERFIQEMAKLGYSGLSIPERYGGHELGNLAMILTTEELSRASLAAAGSLITRPEILAKALLAGGTEAQKQTWLPRLAAGEVMAAISVTEPNVGSDVASVACRAERAPRRLDHHRRQGAVHVRGAGRRHRRSWRGPARAAPAGSRCSSSTSRGFLGHDFEARQPGGGTSSARRTARPATGACTRSRWRSIAECVPDDQVVGGEAGLGRGFYLQMAGFAAGRPADRRAAPRASAWRRSSTPRGTSPSGDSSGGQSVSTA